MPHSLLPNEIHDRIKKGYLNRLDGRVKRMRKLFVERNWQQLRVESIHLKNSASNFGFPALMQVAQKVEESIPESVVSRAHTIPNAHRAVEDLLSTIDQILVTNSIYRF